MTNRQWITQQVRLGLIFLIAGLLVVVVGILLERGAQPLGFDARIVTGVGILLLGISLSYLVRYQSAQRDPKVASRMTIEATDERNQFIRARAGNRAFFVAIVMIYTALMWISFASNGSLPAPTMDALWYYLATSVLVPGGVYATSWLYDQKHF